MVCVELDGDDLDKRTMSSSLACCPSWFCHVRFVVAFGFRFRCAPTTTYAQADLTIFLGESGQDPDGVPSFVTPPVPVLGIR